MAVGFTTFIQSQSFSGNYFNFTNILYWTPSTYLSLPDSCSFRSICSLSTLLAFSRNKTRRRSWFSRMRRVSRDFLAAKLFFLQDITRLWWWNHYKVHKSMKSPSSLPILVISSPWTWSRSRRRTSETGNRSCWLLGKWRHWYQTLKIWIFNI